MENIDRGREMMERITIEAEKHLSAASAYRLIMPARAHSIY